MAGAYDGIGSRSRAECELCTLAACGRRAATNAPATRQISSSYARREVGREAPIEL